MKHEVTIQLSQQQMKALKDGDTLVIIINTEKTEEEQLDTPVTERGGSFFSFFQLQVIRQREMGKVRTSETYQATLGKFKAFRNGMDLSPTCINGGMMEDFQAFLRSQNLSMNSISFYLRILRTVYHRAIEQGLTIDRDPFRRLYTGHDKTEKRALNIDEIKRIRRVSLSNEEEHFARDMFLFSFYTRGMAFVDMAYLKILLSAKTFSSHIKNKVVILAWIPTFFVTFVFAPKHQ